jgi:phage terminase small subunit
MYLAARGRGNMGRNATTRKLAPRDLSDESKQIWREVVREFDLLPLELKLLEAAVRCWDRVLSFREDIKDKGTIYTDRYGQPKERPEVVAERQYKTLFMRLVRELGLSVDAPDSRPPRLY